MSTSKKREHSGHRNIPPRSRVASKENLDSRSSSFSYDDGARCRAGSKRIQSAKGKKRHSRSKSDDSDNGDDKQRSRKSRGGKSNNRPRSADDDNDSDNGDEPVTDTGSSSDSDAPSSSISDVEAAPKGNGKKKQSVRSRSAPSTQKKKMGLTRKQQSERERMRAGTAPDLTFISTQQERIVMSDRRFKLINGCAGSHKTDTLVKCAIRDLQLNRRPILFLSLVGSVTFEIKERLESYLKIKLERHGQSKHYVGWYRKVPISIANFDAWVHLMLSKHDDEFTNKVSATHWSAKTQTLLKMSEDRRNPLTCLMKPNVKVGLMMIDEVQDLQSQQMRLIINIATRGKRKLDVYTAGDYLQTLYEDRTRNATGSGEGSRAPVNAMDEFRSIPKCTYFDLSICMRCPRAHVDFNNMLLERIQRKYTIPPMGTRSTDRMNRPVLFTHDRTSDNTYCLTNARKVTAMIAVLMRSDPSIVPGDIAIIMGKSRENQLFGQLRNCLEELYAGIKPEFRGKTIIMDTSEDGGHRNLDWIAARDKTKMLSIHGDKGKGHRVVFFLGLTEFSIPMKSEVGRAEEILAESKLNVAITRSTEYLFIGFTSTYPSRYIDACRDDLDRYAYLEWERQQNMPEIYHEILDAGRRVYARNPVWGQEYESGTKTGSKSQLQIREDISKDFENSSELVQPPPSTIPEKEYASWQGHAGMKKFGNVQKIRNRGFREHAKYLGTTSELLIQRISNREALFLQLKRYAEKRNLILTSDVQFLSCMCDVREQTWDVYRLSHAHLLAGNPRLETELRTAVESGKLACHEVFESSVIDRDIMEFTSSRENRKLSTRCIWNVTLFYRHMKMPVYETILTSLVDLLTEPVDVLHDNVERYYKRYLRRKKVQYEIPLEVTYSEFTQEQLREFNAKFHKVSMAGRCGIYEQDSRTVIEIKTSNLDGCSEEWIIQVLCYVLMMDVMGKKSKHMSVVNMLTGHLWRWELSNLPSLEEVVRRVIANRYRWHEYETGELAVAIENIRRSSGAAPRPAAASGGGAISRRDQELLDGDY